MSKIVRFILIFLITASLICVFLFKDKIAPSILTMFSSESIGKTIIPEGDPKNTDGHTNVLLLGIDRRSEGSSLLTDTIIVASIDNETGDVVMVSIPRDLWVNEIPCSVKSGVKGNKINSMLWCAKQGELNKSPNTDDMTAERASMETVKKVIANIIGLPIHYYALVDFDAFTQAIDAVGGIDIDVENTFDDNEYPIEGKESAPVVSDRYLNLHFDAGRQHMDGATALQYARSRHSVNPVEAGDFARARRQQKVIDALKDKLTQSDTLFDIVKLKGLFDTYKDNVVTDLTANEVGLFYGAYQNLTNGKIIKIVLSNEPYNDSLLGSGMFRSPNEEERELLYGGLYVLVPNDPSFNQIHAMLREILFK